jgi:putative ABC transport system ATP-binding protein
MEELKTNLVELVDVTKVYHRGKIEITPLKEVRLSVKKGEFLALMGPSGSGKSTLLNLVAAIDTPTHGNVLVNGTDVAAMSESERTDWRVRNIGYVFQFYNLVPVLTAFENVELPLLNLPLSRAERARHAHTALEAVGLRGRDDHYPRQLSGGEEQRVAIARAIVSDPKILLADEPTGDLDATAEEEILDLLKRLNKELGKTLIMVTHDAKAAAVAGRIMRLEKGVITDRA